MDYSKILIDTLAILSFLFVVTTAAPRYLGMVESKQFFADASPGGATWSMSMTLCASSNMELAEITSAGQQVFLKGRYNSADFNGVHWIAARGTVQQPNDYVWSNNNSTFTDFASNWTMTLPYSCVAYNAAASNLTNGNWVTEACSEYRRVLCQIRL